MAVLVILSSVAVAVLPFLVLVRSSVHLYYNGDLPGWVGVGSAFLLTLMLLTAIAALGSKKVSGKFRPGAMARWVALPLVLVYAGYSLLYLSSGNAKSQEVRAYYRSLHPVLRIAVSTIILVDHDLIITDLRRSPADYAAMGLPTAEASLHYRQGDGYVHAMDLRTSGRSAWRNWLTNVYFQVMGLHTLRHFGTADHLHVSLPAQRSRP